MRTTTGYYTNFFGVPVSKYMPNKKLCSVKAIYQELGYGTIVWCSLVTQINDQNEKTMSTPTLDLHGVNRTDMDCSLAMSDAIVKG